MDNALRRAKPLVCAALAAALGLAAACSGGNRPQEDAQAPDFALYSPHGASVHLKAAEAAGPVLVVFWSVYCSACNYMIPLLNSMQDAYGARGLSIIAVSTGDAPSEVADYALDNRLKYQTVVDSDGATARSYHVRGTPTTVLIDRRGSVRKIWVGYSPAMAAQLEQLLAPLLPADGAPETAKAAD